MKRVVAEQRLGFYEENVRRGSHVEVNVVDPLVRKGYRFKGPAEVHEPGSARYDKGLGLMRAAGSQLVDRVRAIVVIEVREARPVVSPAYDDGVITEADMIQLWTSRITTRSSPSSPRTDPRSASGPGAQPPRP